MMWYQAKNNKRCGKLCRLAHDFLLQPTCSMPSWMLEAGKLETMHPRLPSSTDVHKAVSAEDILMQNLTTYVIYSGKCSHGGIWVR